MLGKHPEYSGYEQKDTKRDRKESKLLEGGAEVTLARSLGRGPQRKQFPAAARAGVPRAGLQENRVSSKTRVRTVSSSSSGSAG